MPTIDLSQLPRPQIIESLDYESILKDVKAFMIDAFPENMRSAVSAAIALESEPLNIIAQAIAFREMLLRRRGACSAMPYPQTWIISPLS